MSAKNVIFEKLSPKELQELKELSRKTFTDAFGADNNPDDLEAYLNSAFGEENLRLELLNPLSEFYFAKLKVRLWVISRSTWEMHKQISGRKTRWNLSEFM
ncbi:hypothetical protein [Salinimicrobium sp. TH3]|uniref:hypothetical protein n=1 Tax=Salinimicrobium sp. TH3 TaxID=2997342 RepID=UPI00227393A2|nr:hypothetical protein [Salinimicrobium sp. TH3]MCY2686299.1 hypothetical protein [Salinimicrobium sp. TH3]